MQIRINVKGASRKKAAIVQTTCDYPDRQMTVEEFLAETVRQNVREYNARKDAGEILRLFSNEDGQNRTLNEQFEEHLGMVALFADGIRYTDRQEKMALKELSEVTFIRLTFLAGRMW